MKKMTEAEIARAVAELDGWEVSDSGTLHREFEFEDFVQAFGFMARVALLAEKRFHHPDWSNVYNRVVIDLSSHEVNGLSANDFSLAADINRVVA